MRNPVQFDWLSLGGHVNSERWSLQHPLGFIPRAAFTTIRTTENFPTRGGFLQKAKMP